MALGDIGKLDIANLVAGSPLSAEAVATKKDAAPEVAADAGIGKTLGSVAGSIIGSIGGPIGVMAGSAIGGAIVGLPGKLANQKAPSGPGATIDSGHVGAGPSGDDTANAASQHLGKIAQRGLTNKAAVSGYGKVF